MVKLKKTNELTDLDELLDVVIEGEAQEVVEEEVKEREGEEIAKHIINTVKWMLDGWRVEGLVDAKELVEIDVQRKVYRCRWFGKDTAVVYVMTLRPRRSRKLRNLHSKIVKRVIDYLKEEEEEHDYEMTNKNVIVRTKIVIVMMEKEYYYKELKIYIFCF